MLIRRNLTTASTLNLDPIERWFPLLFKLAVYAFCSYFLYEAATTFNEYIPLHPWPFLLSVVRMFTFLPIHEAGHFFFSFFGRTIMILGGSFWQVMIPFAWCVVALRQRSEVWPFALFWVGENLMDVSLYVRDAQFMALPLLGGDSSGHDWKNLLTQWNAVDSAGTIADILYFLGIIIALGAIATGIGLAVARFVHPSIKTAPALLSMIDSMR